MSFLPPLARSSLILEGLNVEPLLLRIEQKCGMRLRLHLHNASLLSCFVVWMPKGTQCNAMERLNEWILSGLGWPWDSTGKSWGKGIGGPLRSGSCFHKKSGYFHIYLNDWIKMTQAPFAHADEYSPAPRAVFIRQASVRVWCRTGFIPTTCITIRRWSISSGVFVSPVLHNEAAVYSLGTRRSRELMRFIYGLICNVKRMKAGPLYGRHPSPFGDICCCKLNQNDVLSSTVTHILAWLTSAGAKFSPFFIHL